MKKTPKPHLEERFQEHVTRHGLVRPGDSVLLAVSGGIDSMAMLSLFDSFRRAWNLTLGVVHFNHLLRGKESLGDEEFVKDSTAALKLPCYIRRTDTGRYAKEHRRSVQEVARELRYSFFEEIRRKVRGDVVATAHQANDNAETVLMNAARGAGIRGLSGIPLRREPGIVRPILFAYRAEIEAYAEATGVRFREDSTNATSKYFRNTVRHQIIPELERESGANVLLSLNRVSEIMRSLGTKIEKDIRRKEKKLLKHRSPDSLQLLLPPFQREPSYVREEFILHILRMLGVEPTAEKVLAVLDLCSRQTGRSIKLSGQRAVYRDRDMLVFARPLPEDDFAVSVNVGGKYDIGHHRFSVERVRRIPKVLGNNKYTEFVDAERLGSRLVLRSWKTGDRFIPLGMNTKKKLSDFFTDQKVSRIEKSHTPVLESDGEIVWICGKRLDDRFKVTRDTRTAAKLTYRPHRAQ